MIESVILSSIVLAYTVFVLLVRWFQWRESRRKERRNILAFGEPLEKN